MQKDSLRQKHLALTQDEFIKRSQDKFPGKFDYSETIFIDMSTPVILICKTHGRFTQIPSVHLLSKHGCPGCSSTSRKSKGEIYIENFLNSNNIMFNSFVKKDNIVGRLRNYVFIDFLS